MVVVEDVNVAYMEEAILSCSLTGYTGSGAVTITVDKTPGPTSSSSL